MIFQFDITVESSHTIDDPVVKTVKLAYGIITKVGINFPSGCFNHVHVTVNHGLNQIIPSNASGTLSGDNINVTGETFIALLNDPYELEITGYGDNCSYDHTISFRFWMKRLWQLNPFSDQMFQLSADQQESLGI